MWSDNRRFLEEVLEMAESEVPASEWLKIRPCFTVWPDLADGEMMYWSLAALLDCYPAVRSMSEPDAPAVDLIA